MEKAVIDTSALVNFFLKTNLTERAKEVIKHTLMDDHEIWEDSIEWRNAVEEIEKLKKLTEDLE